VKARPGTREELLMSPDILSYRDVVDTARKIAAYAVDLASPDLKTRAIAVKGLRELTGSLEQMPLSAEGCIKGCHMEGGFCVPDN
jgi:hypothetical protein